MVTRAQNTTVRVDYSAHEDDLGRIRLELDRQREAPPDTRTVDDDLLITVQKKHYVRLYPKESAEVRAVNGSIRQVGSDVEKNRQTLLLFDPDVLEASLPIGITNVRVEKVGRTFNREGSDINVTYQYRKTSNSVVANAPHYGAVRVTYDYPYSLYEYQFSGSCPITPPSTQDSEGNAIPLPESPFSDGLIMAVNPTTNQLASLTIGAPNCEYGRIAYRYNDTLKDLKLPNMRLEIDSQAPVRLTGGTNTRLRAECNVLLFPNYGADVSVTAGTLTELSGGLQQVKETLTFNGESSVSLRKTPVAGVNVRVISVEAGGRSVSWAGPGTRIEDVVYNPNGTYSNPRPRTVNQDELVAVDLFSHPVRLFAVVEVTYSASFRKFRYQFSYDDARSEFRFAHVIASDPGNSRGSSLELNPPILKDETKGAV